MTTKEQGSTPAQQDPISDRTDLTPPKKLLKDMMQQEGDTDRLVAARDMMFTTPSLFEQALAETEAKMRAVAESSADTAGMIERQLRDITSARAIAEFWQGNATEGSDIRDVLDWISSNEDVFPDQSMDAYATEMLVTNNEYWQGPVVANRLAQ